jgi:S-adenosylmethionine/arginine decarboxylase-like enzyme
MALHNHLLLNGYTRKPPKDEAETIEWMRQLVEVIDMKILQGPFASYVTQEGNRGLTCVVMIETSHIALHVWDEEDPAFVQFDLYTCGRLPAGFIIEKLKEELGIFDASYLVLERGEGFRTLDQADF